MDCIVHGAAKSRIQLSNFHFSFSKQKVQSSSCSRPLSPLSHQTLWILTLKNLSKPPLLFIFMINSPHQKIFLACVTAVDPLTISLTSLQFKLYTTARIKKNKESCPARPRSTAWDCSKTSPGPQHLSSLSKTCTAPPLIPCTLSTLTCSVSKTGPLHTLVLHFAHTGTEFCTRVTHPKISSLWV